MCFSISAFLPRIYEICSLYPDTKKLSYWHLIFVMLSKSYVGIVFGQVGFTKVIAIFYNFFGGESETIVNASLLNSF